MPIVVIAKCPIPGMSKTRLIPLLGETHAASFARAMLSDVLQTLEHEFPNTAKYLFYAPPTEQGRLIMSSLLDELNCFTWSLLPMLHVQGSHLEQQLTNALLRVREIQQAGRDTSTRFEPILFFGMDAPQLPLDELHVALQDFHAAHICPCLDGGYGMISIPFCAPSSHVFANIRWSHPMTALSQIKALTDASVTVKVGRLMQDIDEPQDVLDLCKRLMSNTMPEPSLSPSADTNDCLSASSSHTPTITSDCPHTRVILTQLNLLSTSAANKTITATTSTS